MADRYRQLYNQKNSCLSFTRNLSLDFFKVNGLHLLIVEMIIKKLIN